MYDREKVSLLKSKKLTVFEDIYQIKLEITHNCTRECSFCGRSMAEKGLMSEKIFYKIVEQLTEKTKRVDFLLHGEPSLNPKIYEFAKTIRDKLPKCDILTLSNMDPFRKKGFEYFLNLYDYGINKLQASLYDKNQEEWFDDQLNNYGSRLKELDVKIYDYYEDRINPFSYFGGKKRILIVNREKDGLNNKDICTRNFHTWGGNISHDVWKMFNPNLKLSDFPQKKICTEPLKYMSVNYNGNVTLCCRDGGRSIVLGNTNKTNLLEIWRGREFQVVRFLLSSGYREAILPCILCNMRSFRVGLNPYWGRIYNKDEIIDVLNKIHRLNIKEPLYHNLLEFSKHYDMLPHIKNIIKTAEKKI